MLLFLYGVQIEQIALLKQAHRTRRVTHNTKHGCHY